ncbi:hypothetical protein E1B28_013652 [Marasmius oreades]|uniref:Purine nucleoside permease n=1 Tax=Marasmius oreades TaxID=181124 RepID=A0A9P7RQ96_9AGAR|nr:uncharacterized protein E1B28_013652 [Marasmius oreades]KAG7087705.1 hypothetical protein E1B28_013652 [Marasmius oreades]
MVHLSFGPFVCLAFSALSLAANVPPTTSGTQALDYPPGDKIAPKVFIFSMFKEEEDVWYNIPEFDVLARNITVPGLSPLFPEAHCTEDGSICHMTIGEGEINAAASVTSLIYSTIFDLRRTYVLIAGIAGGNPKLVTTGSVTFARYAVQVALQYEVDAREIPSSFTTGYFGQGTTAPGQYPSELYGTEVFEVNDALRRIALDFAQKANLSDSQEAQAYRSNYNTSSVFSAATQPPGFALCDTATADTYWAGNLLAEAFENTTTLWTNETGVYCSTQQEDNATLESLLRGNISGSLDFSRVMIMRTISDFDRQFPGQEAVDNLSVDQAGFDISVTNIYLAGVQIVLGIVNGWERQFKDGVNPDNYVGDILGSLGGQPDFGPGNVFEGGKAPSGSSLRRRRIRI